MPKISGDYNSQPEFSKEGDKKGKPVEERYNFFTPPSTPAPGPLNLVDVSYTSYTTGGIHAPNVQTVAGTHFGFLSTPPSDSDEEDSEGVLSVISAESPPVREVAITGQAFSSEEESLVALGRILIDQLIDRNSDDELIDYLLSSDPKVLKELVNDPSWKNREKIQDFVMTLVDKSAEQPAAPSIFPTPKGGLTQKIDIDLSPFQEKVEALFSNSQSLAYNEAAGLVSYIEGHRNEIIQEVRENGAIYIRRDLAGTECPPRSFMATMEGDELKIYVALKKVEGAGKEGKDVLLTLQGLQLGKGSFKTVRLAIDYDKVELVAAATIRPENLDEVVNAQQEYERLKQFGKENGFTVGGCRYSAKSGVGRDHFLLVLPLANRGTTEKLSIDDSVWNGLTTEQRKELLLGGATWLKNFHAAGLCFADGKEANMLWHEEKDGHIKVLMTDVGTMVDLNDWGAENHFCAGSRAYLSNDMADCVAKGQYVDYTKFGKAGDIFTYGMLLWSFTHKKKGLNPHCVTELPPWMTHFVKVDKWGHALDNNMYATEHEKGLVQVTNRLEYLSWLMSHPKPEKRPSMEEVEDVIAHHLEREDEDLEMGGALVAFPPYLFNEKLD